MLRVAALTEELNGTKLKALRKLKSQEESIRALEARVAAVAAERDGLQSKVAAAETAAAAARLSTPAAPPRAANGEADASSARPPTPALLAKVQQQVPPTRSRMGPTSRAH